MSTQIDDMKRSTKNTHNILGIWYLITQTCITHKNSTLLLINDRNGYKLDELKANYVCQTKCRECQDKVLQKTV